MSEERLGLLPLPRSIAPSGEAFALESTLRIGARETHDSPAVRRLVDALRAKGVDGEIASDGEITLVVDTGGIASPAGEPRIF